MQQQRRGSRFLGIGVISLTVLLLALACAGDSGGRVAQLPQQPAAAAQPVPAAPAADPQAPVAPREVTGRAPASPQPAAAMTEEPKYGGILRLANRRDPPGTWDPMRQSTINLMHITGGIFGTGNLVRACREDISKLCPGLAESWETNNDFTQWTFKLRDRVVWHDGTPFTTGDVKFWADLAFFGAKFGDKTRAPARFKTAFGDLKNVEVLEGNRVRFVLGAPAPLFPDVLSNNVYQIGHPRHLMEPLLAKGDLQVAPLDVGVLGTGPFKFDNFQKGTLVQIRRFDQFWEMDEAGKRLPYLDGIDYFVLPAAGSMDAAFRVGRLDGGAMGDGHYLSKERQVGYIRDLGDKVWFAEIGGGRVGLAFNVLNEGPWQDVRVRRAIALWFDKRGAIEAALGGFGFLFTILNPHNSFSNPDFLTWPGWNKDTREADRAEAKRLMAEAGYPDGGFKLKYNCRRAWLPRCQYSLAQLQGLGIDADITPLDNAAWNAGRFGLQYDVQEAGSAFTLMPEQTELDMTTYSRSPGTAAKHEDPKMVEFFDRLRGAIGFDARVKIWRELEQYYLVEQVYMIPFIGQQAVIPYRSYVKGRPVPVDSANSAIDFSTVWLDK